MSFKIWEIKFCSTNLRGKRQRGRSVTFTVSSDVISSECNRQNLADFCMLALSSILQAFFSEAEIPKFFALALLS